jgi:2-phospho-L-lactate guanylyltransferase (CobY/MobA/RfbA family)
VKEEEDKQRLKEGEFYKGMYKVSMNFSQHHVKMLADVIEAIIGAVFLDCLYRYRVDRDNDEEDKENDEDRCSTAIDKVEKIWNNMFDRYLVLYADNPVLPDKAIYYSTLDKLPY